jgi:hypothetical protein
MSIYADLLIDQGSFFSSIVPVNSQKVFDFDLTEFTARGKIKKSYHSQYSIDFDASIPNPTSGNIEISLDSSETAAMKPGRYVFDVEIVETSTGKVTRVQEGQLEVTPGVTSPTDISSGGQISDTSLIFPIRPTNQRTGNARALLFNKDITQKAIGTLAGTILQPTVERLVIFGGDGLNDGEGGDIYLWAGKSGLTGGSGGDIKVDAGDSYLSQGGTVKIRGGNVQYTQTTNYSSGGFVEISAGNSWGNGDGGHIRLTAGSGGVDGTNGNVSVITNQYSQNTHTWNFNSDGTFDVPGMIQLNSGTITSDSGTTIRSYNGDFVITVDETQLPTVPYVAWTFKQDGDLQLPDNGGLVFDRANTSIRVGQGFHIASGEGVSIDSIDQTDQSNTITRQWYFGTNGKIQAPFNNEFYARSAITLINFPAQDSGFGLTTPDGVTHDFTYDYDGTHGPETPILIALGTDTIQNVADKTIAVLNDSGLFGDVHWDPGNNCIWVYQNVAGAIGNQINYNYSYTDGVSSFINGDGAAIIFGDDTVQTTAFRPDDDIEITNKTKGIILTSPNNTRYRVTVADNGQLISTAI